MAPRQAVGVSGISSYASGFAAFGVLGLFQYGERHFAQVVGKLAVCDSHSLPHRSQVQCHRVSLIRLADICLLEF